MAAVGDDLDKCQKKLHDSGVLWPRAELLNYYRDGYTRLVADCQSTIRPFILDLPGRHAYSIVHPWEDRHASNSYWQPFETAGPYVCTTIWEVEQLGGITPSTTLAGITYQWERAYADETDSHYQFALPKNHERIVRIAWDDRALAVVEVRELDEGDNRWMKMVGRPDWWTTGVGRINSIEIYEIVTDYIENYVLRDYESGVPRQISGSRTYAYSQSHRLPNEYAYTGTGDIQSGAFFSGFGWRFTVAATGYDVTQIWEKELIAGATSFTTGSSAVTYSWEAEYVSLADINFFLGTIRRIDSPDRQYVPVMNESGAYGIVRDWKSSENALLVHQVVTPNVDLGELDTPALCPTQMQKYLRFYTLSRAFGRSGEGQNLPLSAFYDQRFKRGQQLFRKLGNIAFKDMVYVRDSVEPSSERPPRVRLPSTFEQIW